MAERPKTSVDQRGTSFFVPLGIALVFVVLVIGWIAMSLGTRDSSSMKDVMSRPSAPSGRTP